LIAEQFNQTLVLEHQRHVVDGRAVVDVDHLKTIQPRFTTIFR
jgi:hypothetical protein